MFRKVIHGFGLKLQALAGATVTWLLPVGYECFPE
jgi:hypothetical protein